MYIFGKLLFGLGVVSYGIAVAFIGSSTAEIFSDLGNGIMLGTSVLLLLNLTGKNLRKDDSKSTGRLDGS